MTLQEFYGRYILFTNEEKEILAPAFSYAAQKETGRNIRTGEAPLLSMVGTSNFNQWGVQILDGRFYTYYNYWGQLKKFSEVHPLWESYAYLRNFLSEQGYNYNFLKATPWKDERSVYNLDVQKFPLTIALLDLQFSFIIVYAANQLNSYWWWHKINLEEDNHIIPWWENGTLKYFPDMLKSDHPTWANQATDFFYWPDPDIGPSLHTCFGDNLEQQLAVATFINKNIDDLVRRAYLNEVHYAELSQMDFEFTSASNQRLVEASVANETRINDAARAGALIKRDASIEAQRITREYKFAQDNGINQFHILKLQLEQANK